MVQSVLLVEDHPMFRVGLRQALSARFTGALIAEAATLEEARAHMAAAPFDILILDINVGDDGNGLVFVKEVTRKPNPPRILMLTMYDDPWMVREAMQAGAAGYLTKESDPEEIVMAVNMIVSGRKYIGQAMVEMLARPDFDRDGAGPVSILSPTEKRILELVADSLTSKEIAERMGIHYRTVENHRTNICQKLGLTGVNSLTRFAIANRSRL